jgi:hypothetical protein
MKARLNLTIDEHLLVSVKRFAQKNDTNVSELVEHFFKKILSAGPLKRMTVIDLVEKLEKPDINPGVDLKDLYYQEQSKKHGL